MHANPHYNPRFLCQKKTEGGSNGQDIPACPEKTGLSEAVFFEDGEGLHLFFFHMLWARKFNDE